MLADSAARRRETIALLVLALLYYAVPWRSLGGVSSWIGAPVVYLVWVVAPGVALVRLSGLRPRDAFEASAWAAMLGHCAALAGCFAWALLGISLDAFRYAFPVFAFALAFLAPPRRDDRVPIDRRRVTRGERRAMWTFGAVLVVVAAIVWASGPTTYYSTDTIDHAAYVDEVARTEDPFPRTAFYRDPGADGADLRKSLLHSFFGVAMRHLGIGALALFSFLGAVQLVILCVAVYAAALWMFERRDVAILSAAIFLLVYDGGIGGKVIRTMFYPNRFGMAPLLMFVAAATTALRHTGPRVYWMCAALGFTAGAVHVQYIVFTALAAAVVVAWKTCSPCPSWRVHLRRSLAAGAAAGAAVAPYALYRYATSYQTNELHHQVQGAMFVAGGWFAAAPLRVGESLGWTGLAALLAVVPLWRRRREVAGVGYTIASLVTVLAIVLNPAVMPAAFRAISYLVFRLDYIVPHYMIAAFLIATLGGAALRASSAFGAGAVARWLYRAAALSAILSVVVGVVRFGANRHMLFASSEAERRISYERWADGLAALSAGIPAGSVIASDPITSYYASAFTPHYVVCTLDQHAPPNDRRADARMAAARNILSPYTSTAEKVALIRANGVTHVVVNEDLPRGLVLNYWTLDPDVAEQSRRALESRPDLFEKVVSRGAMTAYRWTGATPERDSVATPVVAAPPSGARAIGEPSGEATVVAAVVGAGRVAPGDTVRVELYWTRSEPARPANYVVSLRFDKVGLELPWGGRPFPKVARKLAERIGGQLYRFRDDHIFQRGFYGPDRWAAGAIVTDGATVRIPAALSPGTYSVQAKLLAVAAAPNTDLRSYFFDDDMYTGVEVGRIEVAEPH